jgi:hypothetical protein
MSFSKKGFIGAIGDDLPSLIPIVFALLIFFSAFTATLSIYNSENASVSTDMGMLSIARNLKGDSLVLNLSQFSDRCDNIRVPSYPYNFMVGIYSAEDDLTTVVSDFAESEVTSDNEEGSDNFLKGKKGTREEAFFCGYRKRGSKDFGDFAGGSDNIREEYILRYYPVAVQTEVTIGGKDYFVIIPGVLAMIIW